MADSSSTWSPLKASGGVHRESQSPWVLPLFDGRFLQVCARCFSGPTDKWCRACGARYCSKACQVKDWQKADNGHRAHCTPVTRAVVTGLDEGLHRHAAAALVFGVSLTRLPRPEDAKDAANTIDSTAFIVQKKGLPEELLAKSWELFYPLPPEAGDINVPMAMLQILGALALRQSRTHDTLAQLVVLGSGVRGLIEGTDRVGLDPAGRGRGFVYGVSARSRVPVMGCQGERPEEYWPSFFFHHLKLRATTAATAVVAWPANAAGPPVVGLLVAHDGSVLALAANGAQAWIRPEGCDDAETLKLLQTFEAAFFVGGRGIAPVWEMLFGTALEEEDCAQWPPYHIATITLNGSMWK